MTPLVVGQVLFVSANCVATVKPPMFVLPGGCGVLPSKTESPFDQEESSYARSKYQSLPKSVPSPRNFHEVPLKLSSNTCAEIGTSPAVDGFANRSVTAPASAPKE